MGPQRSSPPNRDDLCKWWRRRKGGQQETLSSLADLLSQKVTKQLAIACRQNVGGY
jgi:hypothetical protein